VSHHINKKGQFQSDKYPELPPDKIILSFNDSDARLVLYHYASLACMRGDKDLGRDIISRIKSIENKKFEIGDPRTLKAPEGFLLRQTEGLKDDHKNHGA